MHRLLLSAALSLSLLLSTLVAAQDVSYTFTTFRHTAFGINDSGQIVGRFVDGTGFHGFLTSDGVTFTIIKVPVPSTFNTRARGINSAGQIVGLYQEGSPNFPGASRSFLATPVVVDTTPPVVTVIASPETLGPPNGKLVTVGVSGTITEASDGSGVQGATYTVTDEYDQLEPYGTFLPAADGSYAFTVDLQASRRSKDQDGRQYTIAVSPTDQAGNSSAASATVTVPRR